MIAWGRICRPRELGQGARNAVRKRSMTHLRKRKLNLLTLISFKSVYSSAAPAGLAVCTICMRKAHRRSRVQTPRINRWSHRAVEAGSVVWRGLHTMCPFVGSLASNSDESVGSARVDRAQLTASADLEA